MADQNARDERAERWEPGAWVIMTPEAIAHARRIRCPYRSSGYRAVVVRDTGGRTVRLIHPHRWRGRRYRHVGTEWDRSSWKLYRKEASDAR